MKTLATIFQALSNLDRLKIVAALILYNELLSCQIINFLGQPEQNVSEHLVKLINVGLVKTRKDNDRTWYKLNKDSRDFETIAQMIKNRMDNDLEFQTELNRIDEILAQDPETIGQ